MWERWGRGWCGSKERGGIVDHFVLLVNKYVLYVHMKMQKEWTSACLQNVFQIDLYNCTKIYEFFIMCVCVNHYIGRDCVVSDCAPISISAVVSQCSALCGVALKISGNKCEWIFAPIPSFLQQQFPPHLCNYYYYYQYFAIYNSSLKTLISSSVKICSCAAVCQVVHTHTYVFLHTLFILSLSFLVVFVKLYLLFCFQFRIMFSDKRKDKGTSWAKWRKQCTIFRFSVFLILTCNLPFGAFLCVKL